METLRLCTECREPLPTDSSERICQKCQSDPGRTAPASNNRLRPAPPSPADIAPYFPQLEILELWDYGGMGMIYKARQPQLNRIVALKILSPDLSGESTFAERFSREAQSLARLNHSNIVGIYDFGQAGGYYFFVMEFVDGANLFKLIQGKQLTADDARRIVIEICSALQYAHEEGVIHRDIKPSNILIDKRGRVKIADFGLAKLTGNAAAEQSDRPVITTAVMGTPHYIAPEQIETPSEVDHRADLYSLGVVFYEMLTGQLPLGRFEPPSQKDPTVDSRLDEVVMRTLERDPRRRYQQAGEIRAAVETATMPLTQPASSAVWPEAEPRKSNFWLHFTITAGTALLAVVVAVLITKNWPAKKNFAPAKPPTAAKSVPAEEPEAPIIGKRLIAAMSLTKAQTPEISRIFHKYQRDYILVERRYTEHTRDKAGHVHLTVNPFPEEMDKMVNNMLADFGAFLNPDQEAAARNLNFARFFPHDGKRTVTVDVWRGEDGEIHDTETEDPPSENPAPPRRGAGRNAVPQRYRSYLQDAP